MSERTNRVRLSDQEKRIVDATTEAVHGDGSVPRGAVIARACRTLLSEQAENENDGDLHV